MKFEEIVQSLVCRPSSVAVVGASPNPDRPVSGVMAYLAEKGFLLFPVNPAYEKGEISGAACLGSLLDLQRQVDIVAFFVAPKNQAPALADLKKLGYRPVVWMQPGAENPEAEKNLEKEGFTVVSGACLMKTHRTACPPSGKPGPASSHLTV